MEEQRKGVSRFWTGVGAMVLGLVVALITYISIIGPIIGLALIGFGILTLMWPETEEERAEAAEHRRAKHHR